MERDLRRGPELCEEEMFSHRWSFSFLHTKRRLGRNAIPTFFDEIPSDCMIIKPLALECNINNERISRTDCNNNVHNRQATEEMKFYIRTKMIIIFMMVSG